MSFFRVVNKAETKRITAPDGESYIEVLADISKADFNKLVKQAPRVENDIDNTLSFAEKVVEYFVVGWSHTDDAGKPVPFDIPTFRALPADVANWVSQTVINYFNEKSQVEEAAKKLAAQDD